MGEKQVLHPGCLPGSRKRFLLKNLMLLFSFWVLYFQREFFFGEALASRPAILSTLGTVTGVGTKLRYELRETTQNKQNPSTERESVCCLLVLNSVTSTPQWIRQPMARGFTLFSQRLLDVQKFDSERYHQSSHTHWDLVRTHKSRPLPPFHPHLITSSLEFARP